MARPRAVPAAVLWDMDGTIIDTEPYWMAEEHDLVTRAGGSWTDEDGLALVGNDLTHSAEFILASTPVTGTPRDVVDQLLAGVIRRTQQEVPWRPGARELLAEAVQRGVPNALVTMSWNSLAAVLVGALPPDTFAQVVTGDAVDHGKPHPEPYLLAARRLGVPPQDCVAIEDSPTGVRSAVAAGVPTLAVPHIVSVPQQQGARQLESLNGVALDDLLDLVAGCTME